MIKFNKGHYQVGLIFLDLTEKHIIVGDWIHVPNYILQKNPYYKGTTADQRLREIRTMYETTYPETAMKIDKKRNEWVVNVNFLKYIDRRIAEYIKNMLRKKIENISV